VQVPYDEGVANHIDFESCAVAREGGREALTGERGGQAVEAAFCIETLEDALARRGKPDIFNTDQGSQFTGSAFTGVLANNDIAISMDAKGLGGTMSSSSGCGATSNMSRCICGPTKASARPGRYLDPRLSYLLRRPLVSP